MDLVVASQVLFVKVDHLSLQVLVSFLQQQVFLSFLVPLLS